MNVPNLITLARLFSVPLIVWMILNGDMLAAFWVFLIAALSDAADGIIAKQFNSETVLGAFLDPITDKALLVSVYLTLGHQGYLETWLVIMVVFRDALIVGGAILFHTVTLSLTMQPLLISKVNTFMQLILAIGVLGLEGFAVEDGVVFDIITYIVVVTTVWSGVSYVVEWSRRAAAMEGGDDREKGK